MESDERLGVLLVSGYPPPMGGISRWTVRLERFAANCPDVEVRIVNSAPRSRGQFDLRRRRRITAGATQFVRVANQVCRLAIRWSPDVVHLNTSGSWGAIRDVVIIGALRAMGIPTVYHLRFGSLPTVNRKSLEWRLMRTALRSATTVIVLDQATASAVKDMGVVALSVPNPVDIESIPAFVPHDDRRRQVVFVGHVRRTKGIFDLLEAWRDVALPSWRLLVIGEVDPAEWVTIQEAAGEADVEFRGEVSEQEVLGIVAESAVFCLPSHTEGFPNSVVEAMAVGTPVVATSVGAIAEMLGGDVGVVVPPHQPRELGRAIGALMVDKNRRAELGNRALVRARDTYSFQKVFVEYVRIWRSAVSRSATADRGHSTSLGRWGHHR